MTRRGFFKWLGLGSLGLFGGGAAWGAYDPGNKYYTGPKSNHFNGDVFFNPGGIPPRAFGDLLKWQLTEKRAKWPKTYPSPFHGSKPPARVVDGIRITMVGHATILIQAGGLNFLTDPVWSDRASPFQFVGPRRINPPGINFADLPEIDYVLITHNHYDHMDLATLKRLSEETGTRFICPLGNDRIISGPVDPRRIKTGDWSDVMNFKNGMKLHFEPCHHWSARGTKDRRWALWAAFVLETPAGKIYHIGDTGFHDGIFYKALREKHGVMDVAILPIGAYEPRWFMKGQHQNPDEAAQGHKLLGAKTSIAHHWGTFQLTNEGIEDPLNALAEAKSLHEIAEEEFVVLRPGEAWSQSKT